MKLDENVHPLAATFPLIEGPEFDALVASIREHGQKEPIAMSPDGVLLDGRNRLRACRELGIAPRIKIVEGDPEAYILATNMTRRHMSTDQRIVINVMRGVRDLSIGSSRMYDKAEQVFRADPDRAREVLAGERGIVSAHNRCFPRPHRPRKPAAASVEPVKPKELVDLEKARASKRESERKTRDLIQELANAQDVKQLFLELSGRPLPPIGKRELGGSKRDATAIALLSDVHCETLVRPYDTPTGNTYTLEIARMRLQRFFDSVLWNVKHNESAFHIRDLVLWLGGDMHTNHLHEENVETAQLGPAASIMWIHDVIAAGIRQLLEHPFERIDIPCSNGNHGRTTKTMRAATSADHSWEWVMYQSLALLFKDEPRVRFLADRTAHQYHDVYGFKLHFHHGHEVRYGGGVGGVTIPLNKAVAGWDRARLCDYHFFGHFHTLIDLDRFAVNGSVIGYDPYAMSLKADPQEPLQLFNLIDSERGKCIMTKLWVGDRSKEREIWEKVKFKYEGEWRPELDQPEA